MANMLVGGSGKWLTCLLGEVKMANMLDGEVKNG